MGRRKLAKDLCPSSSIKMETVRWALLLFQETFDLDYLNPCIQVPINADIIFSIVDKDGVKTRAKRCEYTFEKNLPSDNRGFAKWVSVSCLS